MICYIFETVQKYPRYVQSRIDRISQQINYSYRIMFDYPSYDRIHTYLMEPYVLYVDNKGEIKVIGNIIGEVEYSGIQKIENIDPINQIQTFNVKYIKNFRDVKQSGQSFAPTTKKYITALPSDDINLILAKHDNILLESLVYTNDGIGDIVNKNGKLYFVYKGKYYDTLDIVIHNVMRYTSMYSNNLFNIVEDIDVIIFLFTFKNTQFQLQVDISAFSNEEIAELLNIENQEADLILAQDIILSIDGQTYHFDFEDIQELEE